MQVIDNFLPKHLYDRISRLLLTQEFPWYFQPSVASLDDDNDFYFTHRFYRDGKQQSPHFQEIIHPIIGRLGFDYMIRAIANLYTRKEENKQNGFHLDLFTEHVVGLYSVNTNDGYTVFEDGSKIPSVANTMVLFNGKLKHASVCQTDEKIRVNINFNFIQ
jgi:hypothetical protein